MNTDDLIEKIHSENITLRQSEHCGAPRPAVRVAWRIVVPAVATAAILLIVLLPRGNEAQAAVATPGIYCNSQCNPDDVLALIDNNINHIKTIQLL